MKFSVMAAISLLSLTLGAQEIPPFANITSVDFRGSGCDAESARVTMTTDLSYISVLYDRFSVGAGAGTAKPLANADQKNCMIVVKFDLPAGWSFQFEAVEYRGFVSLPDSNSIANQVISVSTPQGKGRNFEQNVIRGPIQDNFVNVYRNPIENLLGEFLKPGQRFGIRAGGPPGTPPGRRKHIRKGDLFDCSDRTQQAVLRIGSRISVRSTGPAKAGMQMIVDSTDASFNQKLRINWNKCLRD
jgi:hypothetical protein